jgi:hypothetical protein
VVENVVRTFADGAARLQIPDVALHHPELPRADQWVAEDFVQIGAMAGREIVDPDNCLPESEQLLKEVGADEASDSCDDPGLGS